MPALDMPAGVLPVRAQDLLPGDVVDAPLCDDISYTVTDVTMYPGSRSVWVGVRIERDGQSTRGWMPLWMDSEVICTRRQAA